MISRLLFAIERGADYVRKHPHIAFVLILIIVMPLLFLYSGQQFLDVGRDNQDRLQKDRIGLLHDAFVSVVRSTASTTRLNQHIAEITTNNPDLTEFFVTRLEGVDVYVVAAIDTSIVGTHVTDPALYKIAAVQLDESLIFATEVNGQRRWQTYRAFLHNNDVYVIYVEQDLSAIDALFASRELSAYASLIFVFLFVIGLAIWHIKLTDYRYLYQKVAKANEMKDLFTNMIAHELRAPLTAMRGYASLITEDANAPATTKEQASRIQSATERLITIVNDLLDVARLQSGKLKVEHQSVDISKTIIAVIEELTPTAFEKKIELSSSGTSDSHIIVGDERRLHQVFTNLLSNSIKYTPSGSIEMAVTETSRVIEVRVKDTGMGISAEDQKKLFAPFFRVESQDVSQITGTGLGMWITKQMIELMDGTVAVESIKGVGTHVVVTFKKTAI